APGLWRAGRRPGARPAAKRALAGAVDPCHGRIAGAGAAAPALGTGRGFLGARGVPGRGESEAVFARRAGTASPVPLPATPAPAPPAGGGGSTRRGVLRLRGDGGGEGEDEGRRTKAGGEARPARRPPGEEAGSPS